ncbi:MAG: adenosylcobinamide-phosphate synthase CbiB [Alphaproteobacteria bacterium]|nr:adenosylcobinamide-phosphate synthase CbiB [Alphaproteobacteria bacterium]
MFLLEGIVQALLLALVIDRLIGDPGWLYRYIPHPVEVIGGVIADLERWSFGRVAKARELFARGRLTTLVLVSLTFAIGLLIQWLCLLLPYGWVILGILMSTLLAQVSLAEHVRAVADGLEKGLAEGQDAVAHIVGRDPDQLDEHGVARSAIESLAENFSDGVVAPAFYAFVLGLPGMLAYKAINTADSMIGHKSERYLHFGRFAAHLDDAANWLPARLSALLIAIGARFMRGASFAYAWQTISRDAHRHRSPNGGWPEAAMAGALDIRLSGPRSYLGKSTEDAWIGSGNPDLTSDDIDSALRLFWWSSGLMTALVLVALLVL